MLPLADALKALLLLMEAQGYPYALGGALALGVWSQPRGTKDIDVTLWLDGAPLRAALEHLTHQGGRGDVDQALADAQNTGLAVITWHGVRLDVFVPSIDFYAEAFNRRVRIHLPGIGDTWVLSAESLVVFKLLFFRGKDQVDVEQLIKARGAALDANFVRQSLVDAVGPSDERVVWWDAHAA